MADDRFPNIGDKSFKKFLEGVDGITIKLSDDGKQLYIWPADSTTFTDSTGREQDLFGLSTSHFHLVFDTKKKGVDKDKYYLKRIQITVRVGSFDRDFDPDNTGFHKDLAQDDLSDRPKLLAKVDKCITWWSSPGGLDINNNVARIFREMKERGVLKNSYQDKWANMRSIVYQSIDRWTGNPVDGWQVIVNNA